MATSLIESQRESHYALEQYEDALVQLLCVPEENYRLHRERLGARHRASYLLDSIADRSSELRDVYTDDNGLRRNEIESIANGGIGEFYDRLAKLKDYHRRFPETAARGDEDEHVDFSGLTGPGLIDGQDCECLNLFMLREMVSIVILINAFSRHNARKQSWIECSQEKSS